MKRMSYERWGEIQRRLLELQSERLPTPMSDFVVSGRQTTTDLEDCIEEIKALNKLIDRQAERISRMNMRVSIAGTQTDDPATKMYLLETLNIVNREGHFG